jgi:translation initiation factor IF-3
VVKIQKFIRANERIRVSQIRLIGPAGEQLGIVPTQKGLEIARQNNLDLVEVAPAAQPPVCRVMDFSKFKYEEEKRERQAKKKQHQAQLKEIRVKPKIQEHDYLVKLKQLEKFLKRGDRVKLSLFFRGREMAHQDLGKRIIDRFIKDAIAFGQIFKPPKQEGKVLSTTLMPK